nr:hypothetical protein [Tanacetum cinerariifolium]
MSSSSSKKNLPCAACKILRRKCAQACGFAPYFPADQPEKFADVHAVFGAAKVENILEDLSIWQREDAVNALAYEAAARQRDPVYGSAGVITALQHRLNQAYVDLSSANQMIATLTQVLKQMRGTRPTTSMMPNLTQSMQPMLEEMGGIGASSMMPQAQYASMQGQIGASDDMMPNYKL